MPDTTLIANLNADLLDGVHLADIRLGQNLLHNWDFRNPVNQRIVSGAISTAGYFYDRWLLNSGAVTTNAAYLTIGAGAVIEQRIEFNLLAGKTVTVSVMVGGVVYSGAGTMPTSAGTASVTLTGWGTATLGYATGYMYVRLTATASTNVQRVKIEMGNISTLAYDPPMDYGAELAKCQRYCVALGAYPIGNGVSGTATTAYYYFDLPVKLRINPTMSQINGRLLTLNGAVNYTGLSASLVAASSLQIECSTTGLTPDRPLLGQILSAGNNVIASSDL